MNRYILIIAYLHSHHHHSLHSHQYPCNFLHKWPTELSFYKTVFLLNSVQKPLTDFSWSSRAALLLFPRPWQLHRLFPPNHIIPTCIKLISAICQHYWAHTAVLTPPTATSARTHALQYRQYHQRWPSCCTTIVTIPRSIFLWHSHDYEPIP